uniref:Uncharacterized protein n=1 Tax=Cyclopterus lumpus TaxID=8103 RepID=A0A8C2WYA6_CYCLU
MGAKQSSPAAIPAANGRTRAYSGSDTALQTTAGVCGTMAYSASVALVQHQPAPRSQGQICGGALGPEPSPALTFRTASGAYNSQESGGSSPEEADRERPGGGHEVPDCKRARDRLGWSQCHHEVFRMSHVLESMLRLHSFYMTCHLADAFLSKPCKCIFVGLFLLPKSLLSICLSRRCGLIL